MNQLIAEVKGKENIIGDGNPSYISRPKRESVMLTEEGNQGKSLHKKKN